MAHEKDPAAGHKELGTGAAVRQLVPLASTFALGAVWACLPPVRDAFLARLMLSTVAVTFQWQVTIIIIAHMAKEPLVGLWRPTIFLAPCVACVAVWGSTGSEAVWMGMWACHVGELAGYFHYVVSVIFECCAFLGIRCFTIPSHHHQK